MWGGGGGGAVIQLILAISIPFTCNIVQKKKKKNENTVIQFILVANMPLVVRLLFFEQL
jgi:hypothetical protein